MANDHTNHGREQYRRRFTLKWKRSDQEGPRTLHILKASVFCCRGSCFGLLLLTCLTLCFFYNENVHTLPHAALETRKCLRMSNRLEQEGNRTLQRRKSKYGLSLRLFFVWLLVAWLIFFFSSFAWLRIWPLYLCSTSSRLAVESPTCNIRGSNV